MMMKKSMCTGALRMLTLAGYVISCYAGKNPAVVSNTSQEMGDLETILKPDGEYGEVLQARHKAGRTPKQDFVLELQRQKQARAAATKPAAPSEDNAASPASAEDASNDSMLCPLIMESGPAGSEEEPLLQGWKYVAEGNYYQHKTGTKQHEKPELPRGWFECFQGEKVYYRNAKNATQWDEPLPEGWVADLDHNDEPVAYRHSETNTIQNAHPKCPTDIPESDAYELPKGWQRHREVQKKGVGYTPMQYFCEKIGAYMTKRPMKIPRQTHAAIARIKALPMEWGHAYNLDRKDNKGVVGVMYYYNTETGEQKDFNEHPAPKKLREVWKASQSGNGDVPDIEEVSVLRWERPVKQQPKVEGNLDISALKGRLRSHSSNDVSAKSLDPQDEKDTDEKEQRKPSSKKSPETHKTAAASATGTSCIDGADPKALKPSQTISRGPEGPSELDQMVSEGKQSLRQNKPAKEEKKDSPLKRLEALNPKKQSTAIKELAKEYGYDGELSGSEAPNKIKNMTWMIGSRLKKYLKKEFAKPEFQ